MTPFFLLHFELQLFVTFPFVFANIQNSFHLVPLSLWSILLYKILEFRTNGADLDKLFIFYQIDTVKIYMFVPHDMRKIFLFMYYGSR